MSDSIQGFNSSLDGRIILRPMFDTLVSGQVNQIVQSQDVDLGTVAYFQNGAPYTITGVAGDAPHSVVTGVQSFIAIDDITPVLLTPPANTVSAQIFVHNRIAIYALDGTAPVKNTTGFEAPNGALIELRSLAEINGFRILRKQAAGVVMVIYVVYYNLTPEGMV